MVDPRRRFRFTIGQGMWIIAALAALFAIMPMPMAIDVAFATTCLLAIGGNRLCHRTDRAASAASSVWLSAQRLSLHGY